MKICVTCKQTLPEESFWKDGKNKDGLRSSCKGCLHKHQIKYLHDTKRYDPYSENKNCALYLGIHIAERLLANVFTNVTRMPFGNKGYDFICGKGFKVDVKSSCLQHPLNRYVPRWEFRISKNNIPDYFALIAFDNRQSLTPLHFWFVPRELIKDKTNIAIFDTQRNISNWLIYEQPLDKIFSACDVLRAISTGVI